MGGRMKGGKKNAAQVIAATLLRAERLAGERLRQSDRGSEPTAGSRITEQWWRDVLTEAWRPFAMGHKAVWWEAVALPEDVDIADEPEFRLQMKKLATKSLDLLKSAIYTEDCAPFFSIEIYSRVIGMFELNNLAVVVPSPIENYFLRISDLPDKLKEEAEVITQPLLDALGEDYAAHCEGTAFYALQSCANHSCEPNARAFKGDEDDDGKAVLVALRDIKPGEEVTISYIDESGSLEERRAALKDYGFICSCQKCVEEAADCS